MLEIPASELHGWTLRLFVPRIDTVVGIVTAATEHSDGQLHFTLAHAVQVRSFGHAGVSLAREHSNVSISREQLRRDDDGTIWAAETDPYGRFVITLSPPPSASRGEATYPWPLELWIDSPGGSWSCPVPAGAATRVSFATGEPSLARLAAAAVTARIVPAGLALTARGAEIGTLRPGESRMLGAWSVVAAVGSGVAGPPRCVVPILLRFTMLGVPLSAPRRRIASI
ncbi:MAG: hypothetical protein IT374_18660 [Polyangiaceae bacterium]|nr:hypothetical protein [Polyangiaceae bacterium]